MNQKGEPDGNYFRVSHTVFESDNFKQLNAGTKVLYFGLCKLRNRFGNKTGIFFRSDKELGNDTGLNPTTVWRARHELLAAKLIRWKQGKSHQACLYQIVEE